MRMNLKLCLPTVAFIVLSCTAFGETETELVRVKPADIGPKEGRNPGLVSVPDTESSPKSASNRSAGTLEIIFDASNSMNAKIGGIPKINLAREAMFHLLDVLDDSSFQTGFRVFGLDRNISREDRPRACVDSHLLVPIAKSNAAAIRSKIPGLIAWGRTPIAYSLEKAGEDLDDFLEANPMVLLISDGVESCDGNPLKVIADLDQRGIKFQTHVIGFDLKPDEKKALQAIATLGGGKYYDAANYGQLLESLDRFARDAKVAEPPKPPVYLNPVVGGDSFENAVEIGAGAYTIRDPLGKGEYAWFKVPSTKSQRVALRATVQGGRMIRDSSGKLTESKVVSGGTTLQIVKNDRPDRPFSTILLSSGTEVGDWKRTHQLDTTGDGVVFRIGSETSDSSPNALIEVIVQEAGDLYEGYEAPDSHRSPDLFEIPLNDTFYGHLGAQDREDAFHIPLGDSPPAKLKVSVKFSDVDVPLKHKLEFYNGDTLRRIDRTSPAEGPVTVTVPTQGASSVILVIHDELANSVLRTYMNSYEIRIVPGA